MLNHSKPLRQRHGLSTAGFRINQTISLARRRVIHVERVAALRDLISAA